ncbi:hypothetical protein NL444_27770, partial [Klebsiella pneumoniae]|nr:hypothetical protein [Klebsiella pneumoniae]
QVNAAIALPFPRQCLMRDEAFHLPQADAFDFGSPAPGSRVLSTTHCAISVPFGPGPQWLHLHFYSLVSTAAAPLSTSMDHH